MSDSGSSSGLPASHWTQNGFTRPIEDEEVDDLAERLKSVDVREHAPDVDMVGAGAGHTTSNKDIDGPFAGWVDLADAMKEAYAASSETCVEHPLKRGFDPLTQADSVWASLLEQVMAQTAKYTERAEASSDGVERQSSDPGPARPRAPGAARRDARLRLPLAPFSGPLTPKQRKRRTEELARTMKNHGHLYGQGRAAVHRVQKTIAGMNVKRRTPAQVCKLADELGKLKVSDDLL